MKTMGISAPGIARKNSALGKSRANFARPDTRVCVVQPVSKAKVTLPKLGFKAKESGS